MLSPFSLPARRIKDKSKVFSWDVVTSATSYNIFYGTSAATYTQSTAVGNVIRFPHSQLNPGMTIGVTYYCVCRATDGSSSSDSNEIQVLNGEQVG